MLLLLDIDGVMVHASPWKRIESLDDGFYKFAPKALQGLKRILFETGASIVLTSSHKSSYNLDEWKMIFEHRGIETTIQKLEDNVERLSRKEEITRWIAKNDFVEDFVILDDDKSLHDLPMGIKEKVVFTQPYVGLTEENALRAIEILSSSGAEH